MGINKGQKQDPNQSPISQSMGDAQSAFENHNANHQAPPSGNQESPYAAGGNRQPLKDFNTTYRRPFSRHQRGENLGQYMAVFQQLIDASDPDMAKGFRLLALDNSTTGLPLSCLLVVYSEKVKGETHRSIFTLILEGSFGGNSNSMGQNRNILPAMNREIAPGRFITTQLTAGDIQSEDLWQYITHHVNSVIGSDAVLIEAGNMTIPHEVRPNKEDPLSLSNIWFTATQAAFTKLDWSAEEMREAPFSVDQIDTRVDQIMARMSFSNNPEGAQTLNAVEMPVRSDVRVTVERSPKGQNFQSNNPLSFDGVREIAAVDAFVDLAYEPGNSPGQVQQSGWGLQAQAPVSPLRYRPRIVMTRADTEIDAITMELQLLAIASSTLLLVNDSWINCFEPRTQVDGVDFRDIGAVGYEVNLTGDPNRTHGEPVPTKSAEFQNTPGALRELLGMVCHREPLISMDIDEAGELTWIQDQFMAAAANNNTAIGNILQAANNLTNNQFAKYYDPAAGILRDDNVRMHTGYYVTKNGTKRDLRDVDYLAVLNKTGNTDRNAIVEFSETFDNVNVPMEERAAKRLEIIKATLGVGDDIRITGYARRYTFAPKFLEAIMMGCHAAGLTITAHNLHYDQNPMAMRGRVDHSGMAMSANQIGSAYTQAQTFGGTGFSNATPYSTVNHQSQRNPSRGL